MFHMKIIKILKIKQDQISHFHILTAGLTLSIRAMACANKTVLTGSETNPPSRY